MKSFIKAFGWPGFAGVFVLLAGFILSVVIQPRPGPRYRRITEATQTAIEASLERYLAIHGTFPEPAHPEETAEIRPGVICRIGGAKCLYQALRGDGSDAIKAKDQTTPATASDGDFEAEEIQRLIFKDMPLSMWRKVGNSYIIVDGYGRPFQYIKADPEKKNTINSTYDLWSYGDDDTNLRATSKDTEANPALGAKWIKNW